jgi:Icc-related predicted phosphoesterase
MKIVTISDTHGDLPDSACIPEGDIFIHAGDICPNWTHHWRNDGPVQMNWIHDTFIPWLNKIPCSQKYIVGGNHDGCAEMPEFSRLLWTKSQTLVLRNDLVKDSLGNPVIYGSPNTFCPPGWGIERWTFGSTSDEDLSMIWDNIPEECPIVVTHSPAYEMLDKEHNDHIGSKSLRGLLDRMNFKIHICGHAHSAGGSTKYVGDKLFVNSSCHLMGFESINGRFHQFCKEAIRNLL